MVEMQRSETLTGYHFLSKYQACPRSWYIKYVLHLLPEKTPRSLPFGGAIHHALLTFCVARRRSSLKVLIGAFADYLINSQTEYGDLDEYKDDLMDRGPALLTKWHEEIGETFHEHYRVVEAEKEWRVPLYSGDEVTLRIDRILHQLNTGMNFIIETKTSSWSQTGAAEGVIEGDQATTYLLGAERVRPDLRIQGVIPEILYMKGKVTKCDWFEIIYRSQEELRDWEDQLVGLIQEVSAKRDALNGQTYPLGQLFPRHPAGCNYSHKCSYPHFCRRPPVKGEVPRGYRLEEHREIHSTRADADRNTVLVR